jgi:hypothetical protein
MCTEHPNQDERYGMGGVGLVRPRCQHANEAARAALVQGVDGGAEQKQVATYLNTGGKEWTWHTG